MAEVLTIWLRSYCSTVQASRQAACSTACSKMRDTRPTCPPEAIISPSSMAEPLRPGDFLTAPDSTSLRSEEHTSELQSLMRISYAVFCLKHKNDTSTTNRHTHPPRHHSPTHTPTQTTAPL